MSRPLQNGFTAVVLAAGQGVRMRSERPKALHEVCGLAMLAHVVAAVRDAGAERLVVVGRPEDADSPDFLAAAGPDGQIAVQGEQLGTAHALAAARDIAGEAKRVLVGLGDMPLITSGTVRRLHEEGADSKAAMTVLTATGVPKEDLGRVVRDEAGTVERIVEEADADDGVLAIDEVNSGWCTFDATWLWDALAKVRPAANGELYLTDLAALASGERSLHAVAADDPEEIFGVNDRLQLAHAERAMRDRIRRKWMLEGVTLVDPDTVYIDARAQLAVDVTIQPNTHVLGESRVGPRCEIGPNSVITDTEIGEDSQVVSSHTESASIGRRVSVGPFSRLRPGTVLGDDVYIGNFAEVKNSWIGAGTRIHHNSYVGDASLGKRVNIGAGTVTCNFDGTAKHRTVIGDEALIGSATMLVAPIKVGDRARTGAGAVAISDIPADTTAVGVPARLVGERTTTASKSER